MEKKVGVLCAVIMDAINLILLITLWLLLILLSL